MTHRNATVFSFAMLLCALPILVASGCSEDGRASAARGTLDRYANALAMRDDREVDRVLCPEISRVSLTSLFDELSPAARPYVAERIAAARLDIEHSTQDHFAFEVSLAEDPGATHIILVRTNGESPCIEEP